MNKDLLIEVGFENLPCGYLSSAIDQLDKAVRIDLKENRLEHTCLNVMGTPNRLVIYMEDLAEKQAGCQERITGPPVSAAISPEGEYTKAARGFARSQNVDVDSLVRVETEKGEYLAAEKEIEGESTLSVLEDKVPRWIKSIKFPKVMRWDESGFLFARPVRWLLSLFGDELIEMKLGEISSGNTTRLSIYSKSTQRVKGIEHYFELLRNNGIVLDQKERRTRVAELAHREAEAHGGYLVEDEGLMDDVTNLVESPVALTGNFEERFLWLPREVIVTALRSHQRYFSVEDGEGRLKPLFVAFADGVPENTSNVIKGYEKVLQARLADAVFYFEEDTADNLEDMSEKLKGIVWLEGLGTMAEKAERIGSLAVSLRSEWGIGGDELSDRIKRAARLAKADLASEMVKDGKEFTLLQGYIGREYARVSGEDEEVADAIYEHYMPRFSGDHVPGGDIGALVGLSDKIDTITGCFLQDMIPTGSQDPYALRRKALGVLRILIEREIPVSLPGSIDTSISLFEQGGLAEKGKGSEGVKEKIKDFVAQRFKVMLLNEGYHNDLVSAALVSSWEYPPVVTGVVESLQAMRDAGTLEPMVLAMKRIGNIIPPEGKDKTVDQLHRTVDCLSENNEEELGFSASIFSQEEENRLMEEVSRVASQIIDLNRLEKYRSIKILQSLVPVINRYFDGVMVNVEEEDIRENRHSFLESVYCLVSLYCDFGAIR